MTTQKLKRYLCAKKQENILLYLKKELCTSVQERKTLHKKTKTTS